MADNGMNEFPTVSIIIPVRNEAVILKRCLASLRQLDYPQEKLEIIVADGLSSDNIGQVIREFGVRQVMNDKQIVVSGRNRGFACTQGEVVAFTDADCVCSRDWIRNSIKYFSDDKVAGVTGATLTPEDSSCLERAVGFLFWVAGLFGSTAQRCSASKTAEVEDMPGCNAIYRREALSRVMPVDEDLLTAEDVWMNRCLRKLGYKLILADDVRIWHYRRSSLKRLLRQVHRFAIGRLQVARKDPGLLSCLHVAVGLSLPAVMAMVVTACLLGYGLPLVELSLIFLFALALLSLAKTRSLKTTLDVLLVVLVFVSAWSFGFLQEWLFPLKDGKGA